MVGPDNVNKARKDYKYNVINPTSLSAQASRILFISECGAKYKVIIVLVSLVKDKYGKWRKHVIRLTVTEDGL